MALTSEEIDKTHFGLFQLHILLLGQTFSGWILIIIKFFKKIVSWDNSPKAFGSWTPCGRLGEEVFYLELSKIVLMRLNWLNLSKSSKIRNLAAEWAGSPRWVEFWSSTGSGPPPVAVWVMMTGQLRSPKDCLLFLIDLAVFCHQG